MKSNVEKFKQAKALVTFGMNANKACKKVGIRPQLFSYYKQKEKGIAKPNGLSHKKNGAATKIYKQINKLLAKLEKIHAREL